MTEKDRRREPNFLAKFAIARPIDFAAYCGLLFSVLATLLFLNWRISMASALIMFLLVYFLWRPGGPGRRRVERISRLD